MPPISSEFHPGKMNPRPCSISIISWVFIAYGVAALFSRVLPLVDEAAAQHMAELRAQGFIEFGVVWMMRVLAVVSGVFMLYGFNWARWLLVVWLGYHVILSVFHPPFELIVHGLLFVAGLHFLFRTPATAYFRGAKTNSDIL